MPFKAHWQRREMPATLRIPITNVAMGDVYVGAIKVGSEAVPVDVIFDTGSSALAIDAHAFDPGNDPGTEPTKIAQSVNCRSGSWTGAVVGTKVELGVGVTLDHAYLTVIYTETQGLFGQAQGILGLAHKASDNADLMPEDTWKHKYRTDAIALGAAVDIDPCIRQLAKAGLFSNKFAFYTKRSVVRAASDDPAADPLNQGILVIGGGEDATEFHTGAFTRVAVFDDLWYDVNLIGTQPAIRVAPAPAGAMNRSNSIVDSGTDSLIMERTLYGKIIAAFGAITPTYAAALRTHAIATGHPSDQSQIDLGSWPDIHFSFQGADGTPATLTVAPGNYWQFDAARKGARSPAPSAATTVRLRCLSSDHRC